MKQYCRYCVNLCVGNGIYCQVTKKELSEAYTKSVNNCRSFNFCELDAYNIGRIYKPNIKKHYPHKIEKHQISIKDLRF